MGPSDPKYWQTLCAVVNDVLPPEHRDRHRRLLAHAMDLGRRGYVGSCQDVLAQVLEVIYSLIPETGYHRCFVLADGHPVEVKLEVEVT